MIFSFVSPPPPKGVVTHCSERANERHLKKITSTGYWRRVSPHSWWGRDPLVGEPSPHPPLTTKTKQNQTFLFFFFVWVVDYSARSIGRLPGRVSAVDRAHLPQDRAEGLDDHGDGLPAAAPVPDVPHPLPLPAADARPRHLRRQLGRLHRREAGELQLEPPGPLHLHARRPRLCADRVAQVLAAPPLRPTRQSGARRLLSWTRHAVSHLFFFFCFFFGRWWSPFATPSKAPPYRSARSKAERSSSYIIDNRNTNSIVVP